MTMTPAAKYLHAAGTREQTGGNMGCIATPTTNFSARHLAVSCPACGAGAGSRCRGKYGSMLAHYSHLVRAERARILRRGGAR